ncbi:MAG TPA: hypothetical protein VK177_02565 [Flavobacteriales bacterium]|nr:hypothetical protein [Flavobacteriales bacterium]
MLKNILTFLVIFLLMGLAQEALAAAMGSGMGMGPPSPPCGTPPFPPCTVPIDGGIALLAGAGSLYAYKKLNKKSQKNPA